jgi:hypothetical protein
MKMPAKRLTVRVKPLIKTKAFQCVSFYDPKQERQLVILYSLGEDGILREYVGNKWHPYPVTEE